MKPGIALQVCECRVPVLRFLLDARRSGTGEDDAFGCSSGCSPLHGVATLVDQPCRK